MIHFLLLYFIWFKITKITVIYFEWVVFFNKLVLLIWKHLKFNLLYLGNNLQHWHNMHVQN